MMMEKYETAREDALKHIKIADHVFTMTYPLVNDPKLLKLVLKDMSVAAQSALAALLQYERLYKRVPPFTENFESMLQLSAGVFQTYGISQGYINFLRELKEMHEKQKESEVEFVRKENFVFASRNYDLSTISTKEMKEYLAKTKLFIKETLEVVNENEGRNRKR